MWPGLWGRPLTSIRCRGLRIRGSIRQLSVYAFMMHTAGVHIFEISRRRFKILGANIYNVVAMATWSPECVRLATGLRRRCTPCITYSVSAMFLKSVWYGFEFFLTIFVISKGLRNKYLVFILSLWTEIRYLYRHCEQKFSIYIVIVNKNSVFISSLWTCMVSTWSYGGFATSVDSSSRNAEQTTCRTFDFISNM